MKLNKGSILLETLIALMLLIIISQTIYNTKQLDVISNNIKINYEKRI
ncbi:MAG TPA: hypothetical protein VFC83_00165 [Erysipelotrichaceae bacterium]|nr:hypothetical protein [Erysipelotrichaceae bacterium]